MTVGIALQPLEFFQDTPAELENSEITREQPDGLYDLLPDPLPVAADLVRRAYPWTRVDLKRGVYVKGFFDDFYNRIHVFPNPIDFGYLAAPSQQEFQIWNAFLVPQTLVVFTPVNDEGLGLNSDITLAHEFKALESRTFSVDATLCGPATIAGEYQFTFLGLGTYTLRIIGLRARIFPFPPNWQTAVSERLEWLTSVAEVRNGEEQRARMRQYPRLQLEYDMLVFNDALNDLQSSLFGWQGRAWGVPLWMHGQELEQTLPAGSTFIPCQTEEYEFIAGGTAIIYQNSSIWEPVSIESVESNGLTLSIQNFEKWVAGTYLFPVRIAHIRDEVPLRYVTGEVARGTVRFTSEHHRMPAPAWAATYKGYPVLEISPNRIQDMQENWSRRLAIVDNSIGNSTIYDKDAFSKTVRSHQFTGLRRSKIKAIRDIVYYAEGKLKAFWSCTWNRDIRLVQDVTINNNLLVIKAISYTALVNLLPMRNHIRIQLKNGTVRYYEITGCDDVNTPFNTETLTVDPPFDLTFTVQEVYFISFMSLVRQDSDATEFNWTSMGVADASVPLKTTIA